MIGPWRDPISGRWIVEKPKVVTVADPVLENPVQDMIERVRIHHIWHALQSTAEASQIASTPVHEAVD